MTRASRLAAVIARRPRVVLAIALLLALAAGAPIARLHFDADLARLLPTGSPAARDYLVFLKTFGGFEKVYVMVRSPRGPDPGAVIDAAEALTARLRASPLVAEARSGLSEEDEDFVRHAIAPRMPLLLDDREFAALPARLSHAAIAARVAWMRRTLSSPAGAAVGPWLASDPLGLGEDRLAQASRLLPVDPFTGAFLSRRGDTALVILTPAQAELDPAGGRALAAEISRATAAVGHGARQPLEFAALGGPLYAAEDEALLRVDLARTASSTMLGVALVLVVGFEGLLLPFAILVAVLLGVVWTGGAVGAALGSVSVLGVGFAAALLGMGVDYGIHGGVRFRQARERGADAAAALAGVFRANGPGVLTAALATAGGLSTLALAHFRPLREAGLVLALGILATLLATATASAALVADPVFGRRPPAPPRFWRRCGIPLLGRLVALPARHPWPVLAVALALTGGAAWGLARLEVSTDLRALRPASAPSTRAERQLVTAFGLGADTFSVVLHGDSLDDALDRAAQARDLIAARLGVGAEITSPSDWLPASTRRQRRLRQLSALGLAAVADDLESELRKAGFNPVAFAPALTALRAEGRGEDPGTPPPAEWPRAMAELVRIFPGGGAAVAVHVRLPADRGGRELDALTAELSRRDPRLAVASVARVGAELKLLGVADLRRASGLALVLIALVVFISFRGRWRESLLSFVPLALGSCWTFGAWGAAGQSIDLLGIFTVPLLLSTGIILGVHAVHWRRLHPAAGFAGTFEDMGLAMLLATLTTAVGFGSLTTSRVPGLRNAGILVAAGISCCLLAAFLVLPALEAVGRRRGSASLEERPR